jgi:hypothetical protein
VQTGRYLGQFEKARLSMHGWSVPKSATYGSALVGCIIKHFSCPCTLKPSRRKFLMFMRSQCYSKSKLLFGFDELCKNKSYKFFCLLPHFSHCRLCLSYRTPRSVFKLMCILQWRGCETATFGRRSFADVPLAQISGVLIRY